jgi:endonuclease/exonuclease/phosphatase family metal-dependent hydrolase
MLKILLTFSLAFISTSLLAQLFNEDFKYSTGAPLTANGWTAHSGAGTNVIKVVDGLTYSGLTTTSGAASLITSGEDINRNFPAVKDGNVYVAFLANFSAVQDAGDYFLHLGPTTLSTIFRGKVFAKKSGIGFQVGVTKAGNTPNYAATVYELNKTYLFVLKYTLKSGSTTDDEVVLYVNPTIAEKEPITAISVTPDMESDTNNDIGSIALRQGTAANAPTVKIDGIVVATKWEELFVKNDSPSITLIKAPKQITSTTVVDSLVFSGSNLIGNLFEIVGNGLQFSTKKDFSTSTIGLIAYSLDKSGLVDNGKVFMRIAKAQASSITTNLIFRLDQKELQSNPAVAIELIVNPPANEIQTIGKVKTLAEQTSVKIAGRVTSAGEINNLVYIQDATGGIPIGGVSATVAVGDSLQVFGKLSNISKQLYLQSSEFTKIGITNKVITPKTIIASQMSANEGNLISVKDVSFADKKFVFLPNTNYVIAEGTANATVRVWEGTDIDGRTKPQATVTISGVVGRFNDGYQIYPRSQVDIPGTGKPQGTVSSILADKTFDVTAWNINWYGNAANGPSDEALQQTNVLQVLDSLKSDLYFLEEVSNPTAFKNLLAKMKGYEGVCSSAISAGGVADDAQRVCFIYKTDIVKNISTRPLLKGAISLPNYPSDPARFWASGRLPFLMVADVTVDGIKQRLHIVGIHARANTGGTTATEADRELQYRQRKYDVEVLKDSLDSQFPKENIIIAGDFNDDVDETVSVITSTKESSYKKYVDDAERWQALTKTLSDDGYRTYVSQENVIDHILISNELKNSYLSSSVGVALPFTFLKNYTTTTSDHLPVFARFQFIPSPTAIEPTIGIKARVFPNPTVDVIDIDLDETLSKQLLDISLSNAQGFMVFNGDGTWDSVRQQLNSDFSKRSTGVYFLKIADKQRRVSVFKIMKQ